MKQDDMIKKVFAQEYPELLVSIFYDAFMTITVEGSDHISMMAEEIKEFIEEITGGLVVIADVTHESYAVFTIYTALKV